MQKTSASFLLMVAVVYGGAANAVNYSSGTGFFVSSDGYVVTNNHVIEHCSNEINIYGPANSTAQLIARDKDHDLALLKASAVPSDEAHLSTLQQPLHAGDLVVIVGFPGVSWQTGKTQTREAKIVNNDAYHIKGFNEDQWLEFSDALAQGNSGGPLLDSAGNVVGVVTAKGKISSHNEVSAHDEPITQFDLAISLPVIRKFLSDNNVRYLEADSGIYLSADHVTDIAKRFVVNVRCDVGN